MRAFKDMDAHAGIFILQIQTLAQRTYAGPCARAHAGANMRVLLAETAITPG